MKIFLCVISFALMCGAWLVFEDKANYYGTALLITSYGFWTEARRNT